MKRTQFQTFIPKFHSQIPYIHFSLSLPYTRSLHSSSSFFLDSLHHRFIDLLHNNLKYSVRIRDINPITRNFSRERGVRTPLTSDMKVSKVNKYEGVKFENLHFKKSRNRRQKVLNCLPKDKKLE